MSKTLRRWISCLVYLTPTTLITFQPMKATEIIASKQKTTAELVHKPSVETPRAFLLNGGTCSKVGEDPLQGPWKGSIPFISTIFIGT